MTSDFSIGPLTFDAAAYGTEASAVLGIRGAGKTYTATLIAEKLHECGVPFIAFDPIGVWRFLKTPAPGRGGKGLPVVVAGGEAGDLALNPESAPAIVEAAMREGVSLVIDLFHMDLSKADWRRIVCACVKLLLHRNKPHGIRHVFLEEAAEFAPQIVRAEQGQVYAEIEKLARMGGNSGLGLTLVNQRAEQVNKAVLENCANLFLHAQKGRKSIEALAKWLDAGGLSKTDAKDITATLATLPPGECWAWPAGAERPQRLRIPAKRSLHPDRKARAGDVVTAAPVDVSAFVKALGEALPAIEQDAKDNDPKALRARIKQLETALSKAQNSSQKLLGTAAAAIEEYRARHDQTMRGLLNRLSDAGVVNDKVLKEQQSAISVPPTAAHRRPAGPAERPPTPQGGGTGASAPRSPDAAENATDGLAPRQTRVLEGLVYWNELGVEAPTRTQLAFASAYSPRSSGFEKTLSQLRGAGLIDYPEGARVSLTRAGRDAAPLPADADQPIRDKIRQRLEPRHVRVFDALPETGAAIDRDALADASDYSPRSSGFEKTLSQLKSLGLIVYPEPRMAALQDWVIS